VGLVLRFLDEKLHFVLDPVSVLDWAKDELREELAAAECRIFPL
jgi:hypothetical protein